MSTFDNICKWRKENPDYQNGNRNPAWKGGTSRSNINRITKRVLSEANIPLHICQRCNLISDINLNRHHKDRNRSNNILTNLEVLCPSCHSKEHKEDVHEPRRSKVNGRYTSIIW